MPPRGTPAASFPPPLPKPPSAAAMHWQWFPVKFLELKYNAEAAQRRRHALAEHEGLSREITRLRAPLTGKK